MTKRLILLLIITMILCLGGASLALAADQYSDVAGHPAEASITRWSDLKVIEGNAGKFRPDDTIRRGEMALILDRVFSYAALPYTIDPNSDPANPTKIFTVNNPFTDLPNTWYTEAVLKLNIAEVMLGTFNQAKPLDSITRQEAVVMICRAMGLDTLTANSAPPFADSAEIYSYATNCVALLAERGALVESGNNFRPAEPITRAEVVVILDHLIAGLNRNNGLYNTVVDGNLVVAGGKYMLLNSHINGDLIIAGGQTTQVIIQNSQINGQIINKSNAHIVNIPSGSENTTSLLFGSTELTPQRGVEVNPHLAINFGKDSQGRVTYSANGVTAQRGVDVSDWQKEINWQQVKSDGIDFAIIRVAYRGYESGILYEDEYARRNIEGALAAGLKVGVYVYSSALTTAEAVEEAELALDIIRRYNITYPVVFDWESSDNPAWRTYNLDGATLTNAARAFCSRIDEAGYEPMVYFYGKLAYQAYDLAALDQWDFWFAGYYDTLDFYYDVAMWQYSSAGTVRGINGKVDMNLLFDPHRY